MQIDRLTTLVLLLAGILAAPLPASAGDVLDAVKARGMLRCRESEGIPGFSPKDPSGRWQGLDADFCRVVAAAVVGDGEQVEFVPLRSSTRFPALQANQIDLLARNTTWTLTREAILKVQFPAVLFYDGQGFLVPAASGITEVGQLKGATICVERGTNHRRNLERYAARTGVTFTPLMADSAQEVAAAFFAERCAAYSSDASQLAAARLQISNGAERFLLLPERISEEPLAPVVWGGDAKWTTVVRWVLFGLVLAEKHGVTRDNVEAIAADPSGPFAGQGAARTGLRGTPRLAGAGRQGCGQLRRALRAPPGGREPLEDRAGCQPPLGSRWIDSTGWAHASSTPPGAAAGAFCCS